MEWASIALLLTVALAVNVPLGMWRRGMRRFSPAWFVAIHASIPLLIALRLALVQTNWVIPPEIALAVVGQVVGTRLPRLRRMALGSRRADIDNV
jgi:hypothetical protein